MFSEELRAALDISPSQIVLLRVVFGAVSNDTRAWTGLIFGLGLGGTGLAYVIYYYIVENLSAVSAAGVTYIPPVVALVIGVFLAGDVIHPLGYLAMVLILSGVALLQYGSRRVSVSKAAGTLEANPLLKLNV
ncbi:MAG: EamA family transporter [Acidobacteria bacterium]|nr:EamA family transporter [Acidobacteriota bacterium]